MATSAKKRTLSDGADDWVSVPVSSKKALSDGADDWEEVPKSPSDARAQSFLSRAPGMALSAATGGLSRGIDAFGGSSDAVARAMADKFSLGNLGYSKDWRDQLKKDETQYPKSNMAGSLEGAGGLAVASSMIPGGPMLLGAAQGGLTRPEGEPMPAAADAVQRARQAGVGGATAGALGLLGAGLGKAGDWAMQKAVNLPKYIPGMGTQLADEGLIGTKGFMEKQINGPGQDPGLVDRALEKLGVTGKMAAREKQIANALPRVQGNVPAKASEDAVNRELSRFVPSGGAPVDPGNVGAINTGMDRLMAITKRGDLPPSEALDAFRKIDRGAYDTSVPMGRLQRDFAQADSGAGRAALKGMADSQGIPEVAGGLNSERALINAKGGLEREVPLGARLIGHGGRGGAGALAGAMLGHGSPEAMIAGALAAEAAGTPLALSAAGQAGTKASQAIPYATPGFVDLMVRRALEDQQ